MKNLKLKNAIPVSIAGSDQSVDEGVDTNPRRIFERDERRAIYKWKFETKFVDGEVVEQYDIIYVMRFPTKE